MAFEFSDVDNSRVIAGGVTIANLPQDARNFRRSSSSNGSTSGSDWFWSWFIFQPSVGACDGEGCNVARTITLCQVVDERGALSASASYPPDHLNVSATRLIAGCSGLPGCAM